MSNFNIIPMDQMPVSHDNIFIYGPPGCGKTLFACGSQKRRTFYFNIENGYKTILTWKGDETGMYPPCNLGLIHSTPYIETYDQYLQAWEFLVRNYKNYDLMVLDTATELANTFMRDHLAKRNKMFAEIQDWGFVLSRLEFFFSKMRSLPMTKIVLAHEGMRENKNTGFNTYGPQFKGQARFEYAKHFDEIWRFLLVQQQMRDANNSVVYKTQRVLQISPDQNSEGKTRANALGTYEFPQLDAMLLKMQGI